MSCVPGGLPLFTFKSGVRPRLIQQLVNYRMNMHNYANLYIARLI
jgi:hypothetical protein